MAREFVLPPNSDSKPSAIGDRVVGRVVDASRGWYDFGRVHNKENEKMQKYTAAPEPSHLQNKGRSK